MFEIDSELHLSDSNSCLQTSVKFVNFVILMRGMVERLNELDSVNNTEVFVNIKGTFEIYLVILSC